MKRRGRVEGVRGERAGLGMGVRDEGKREMGKGTHGKVEGRVKGERVFCRRESARTDGRENREKGRGGRVKGEGYEGGRVKGARRY